MALLIESNTMYEDGVSPIMVCKIIPASILANEPAEEDFLLARRP